MSGAWKIRNSDLPALLIDGSKAWSKTIVLAHGAGAPMDSEFMNFFSQYLSSKRFRVVRFEFPYMSARRSAQTKRPPDRPEVLQKVWRDVISHFGPNDLIIGGKSMGGRIASMVADQTGVKGLICLGFPFHSRGRLVKDRVIQLTELSTPTLICQGTRDRLGNATEVATYKLSHAIQLHWLKDGDHDFCPRKKSGFTKQSNWQEAAKAIESFACSLS